jgi:hypothetical protein
MVRSWAYILMVAATLAGLVALVWPSPKVQTIEEIAMPVRTAPTRAEPASKPAKTAARTPPAAKREPAPAPTPAAVAKKMPAPNTTTKRQFAKPDNGMQPSPFQGVPKDAAPPSKNPAPADTGAPPRAAMPFKPGTTPSRNPNQ